MNRRPLLPFLITAAALPLIVYTAGVVLIVTWFPDLPDTIAIHWGVTGEADGWAPKLSAVLMLAGLGLGMSLLFGGMIFAAARSRQQPLRFLAAISLFSAIFLTVLIVWSVSVQRHGSDEFPFFPGGVIALVLGIAAAVLAYAVLPKVEVAGHVDTPADPIPLGADERAVWVRSVYAPVGFLGLFLVLVVVIGVVMSTAVANLGANAWPFGVVGALLLAVLIGSMWARVRVDAAGLHVRSGLGVPRFFVHIDAVQSASAVHVTPVGDFGGWGFRWAAGRFGVVLRAGDAIEVVRTNGKKFVVTVDDAGTAASLLMAYAQRTNPGR